MAGNIVKWWRQFKQYKQFSVLQECTTDSEELLYKTQIPTSAPPDIVLTSHRSKNISQTPTTTTINGKVENKKEDIHNPSRTSKKTKELRAVQLTQQEKERLQKRHSIATTRNLEQLEANRVKLNELSCDVSFNDSPRSPQPVQFSFTLYDLDGHGKITKDDIAGIVSTIYESIGNSVVVPHYGKKTINVKLTVSPDAKANNLLDGSKRHNRSRRVHASFSEEDNDSETASENHEIRSKKCEHSRDVKMNIYESVNNLKHSTFSPEEEEVYVENIKKDVLKHFSENRLRIEEEECTPTKPPQKQFIAPSKKKILRKQRRKQRNINESTTRGRSLSVGNDYKWRKNNNDEGEISNNENLRKHELIEIIKESMEKNRLCFQNKRKSNIEEKGDNQTRPRSNTVTCTKDAKNLKNCTENDQHLCAFDSFLHSTICSNLNSFSKSNSTRVNCKNKSIPSTPVLKLKTSVLNQLDQNLTPEQKLSRKLNDVEKWLYERETTRQDVRHKTRDENFHSRVNSTPKKSLKENIAMKKNTLQPPAPHQLKQHKEAINSKRNKAQFECVVNGSECENLISMSEEEQPLLFPKNSFEESPVDGSETASKSSSVRFVHIHHHFYHFENDGKFE